MLPLRVLVRLGARSLKLHKPRSSPSILGVALGGGAVVAMSSAKWRSRGPSATTRRLVRWRHRCRRVWNFERKLLRTGADTPTSVLGSVLSAWRQQ